MHYIMNVGDAWFAQVPREGNIYVRAANMHDTAIRCTACHPSSFSTEANLVAHRNGYPIRSKSNFQYVIDRIYNSMTPLYGDDGLYWQRFIAIPLQAQGKQGGILLDFEREVSGQETETILRFGPFLERAWGSRRDLPPDELNGVIPLDSKFGFAWRDWRVLSELARRTHRDDFAKAAANIARILSERAADMRAENLQDRIHRLYAWWLIDKTKYASKIKRETGALLALQNADGGWHETDSGPGGSAVYTTGQLTWTLLRIGLPRDHPALAKALRYLLAQQQDFGGWFQTTTHENFRTPMRETRYAVMALAEAFPQARGAHAGMGQPRPWSAPACPAPIRSFRSSTTSRISGTLPNRIALASPEPSRHCSSIPSRSSGRRPPPVWAGLVRQSPPQPWSAGSPIRPRSSGARRPGRCGGSVTRGSALDAIAAALKDPNPATRRGAARIFAYQFQGMDTRLELADSLIELTRDPDLWTRLQAMRSLAPVVLSHERPIARPADRRIYLARMAEPDTPVVRKNLSEGLYIMLDENLGGGVSLQKNIEDAPRSDAAAHPGGAANV